MVSADPGACTSSWGNWCECVGPLEYKSKLREWFRVGLIFCSKRRIDQQFIRASKLGQGSTYNNNMYKFYITARLEEALKESCFLFSDSK